MFFWVMYPVHDAPAHWAISVASHGRKGVGHIKVHRDTSLMRNRLPLGPYSRTMPRALRGPQEGGGLLTSKVVLQGPKDLRLDAAARTRRVGQGYLARP